MTLPESRKVVFTKEMVVLIRIIAGEVKQTCEEEKLKTLEGRSSGLRSQW